MSTQELINAALDAQAAYEQAQQGASLAGQILQDCKSALDAANRALYSDLSTNGPAVVIDDSTTPATITLYTAQEPDGWNSTEIRVA